MGVTTFVEDCLDILANRPAMSSGLFLPRCGSLWVRQPTEQEPHPPRRRGTVLWATEARVCLEYSETHNRARKVHSLQDFVRLYMEVK